MREMKIGRCTFYTRHEFSEKDIIGYMIGTKIFAMNFDIRYNLDAMIILDDFYIDGYINLNMVGCISDEFIEILLKKEKYYLDNQLGNTRLYEDL